MFIKMESEINMDKEKQILMAFFDILGTSKMLNDGNFKSVYDYYTFMANLCSDTHTPIAVVDHISKFLNPESETSDIKYTIINYDLKNCFFSDTFIIWIEIDSFLQPTMAGFLEKCCIIFCEALKRGIPLRGVISYGNAIMDEKNRIFLGKPLAEAAKAEPRQNWLGVGLGKSISSIHPMDAKYLIPYFRHFKYEKEDLLSGWALDWASWWRENEDADAVEYVKLMNTDTRFESYYNNCITFINASKQRDFIWNTFMIFQDVHKLSNLFSLGDSISDGLKTIRSQGVQILTSHKLRNKIQNLLEQSNEGVLSKKDREVLENLRSGYILVDGKLTSLELYE